MPRRVTARRRCGSSGATAPVSSPRTTCSEPDRSRRTGRSVARAHRLRCDEQSAGLHRELVDRRARLRVVAGEQPQAWLRAQTGPGIAALSPDRAAMAIARTADDVELVRAGAMTSLSPVIANRAASIATLAWSPDGATSRSRPTSRRPGSTSCISSIPARRRRARRWLRPALSARLRSVPTMRSTRARATRGSIGSPRRARPAPRSRCPARRQFIAGLQRGCG